jgi:hypothetical protein
MKNNMGLTFHYWGKIRDYGQIDMLVEEVTDLCKGLNWTYTVFDKDRIKGITVNAPESEPLWFTFTPDGKTCDVANLQYSDPSEKYYSLCHTKTQYAGPEVHMTLVKMLRYMSDKYYSEIEMCDEGEYWETGNEENLRRIFGNYTQAINMFTAMLDNMERIPGETAESLAGRIEQMVNEKGIDGVEIIRVEKSKRPGESN